MHRKDTDLLLQNLSKARGQCMWSNARSIPIGSGRDGQNDPGYAATDEGIDHLRRTLGVMGPGR